MNYVQSAKYLLVLLFVFFLFPIFFSQNVLASSFNDLAQGDFSGTFNQTYYNSSGFIRLNQPIPVNPIEMTGNENGLISYWRFNEASWSGVTGEVKDVLLLNNATAKGGATTTSGKFGNAAYFSGSSYVSLPSGVSSSLGGASGATVSMWLRRNQTGVRNSIIDLIINSANSSKVAIDFLTDNTLRCGGRALSTDGFQSRSTTSTFTDTNWHHVVCVMNVTGNDIKIYVDGVQQTLATGTVSFGANNFSSAVGTANNIGAAANPSNYYKGVMDEFAIWNRTLNSSEIAALYQKGNPSPITFNNGTYESNVKNASEIVKWNNISWTSNAVGELPNNKAIEMMFASGNMNMTGNILLMHMNELSGAIADTSGSGNNGTAYNMIYGATGKIGTGLGFNGNNSYINLGVNSIVPDIGNATGLTFSVWINPNSLKDGSADSRNNIADIQTSYNSTSGTYNSAIYFALRWGGNIWCGGRSLPSETFQAAETSKTVGIGKWQHVVCMLDFANKKVYIYYNGVKVNETNVNFGSTTFVAGNPTGPDIIGKKTDTNDFLFNGTMDEVAIWNRTLSDSDISNMYKRGLANLNLTVRSCDDASCSGESYTDINDVSPQNLAIPNNQYFQYKFDFKTDSASFSPELYNVSINYEMPFVDTIPPQISLISPANNSVITNSTPGFVFNATDDVASALSCALWMDNGTAQSYGTTTASNGIPAMITSAQLANGNYSWWINCSDGTNMNASEKRMLTVSVFINPETGPTITLIGTPYEIGTKWAQENKNDVNASYLSFLTNVGKSPTELKAFARIFIDNATSLNSTHWVTEANAIADVIGADHEMFIAFLSGRYRGLASHFNDSECTSFFVAPPATDGEIIFHKTRENSEENQAAYIKYTTGLPPGQEVYKYFAEMGTSDTGISYFLNDQGLAGSVDQGGSAEPPKYNGLMNHYTLRYIAEHAKNVTEAGKMVHFLVENGYTAGANIISNYLFLDKYGNALHISDDGNSIVEEELNPTLDYHGTTYSGIWFTIRRQDANGSPEDALIANYGHINVTLVDGTQVAKHTSIAMSDALSGATFLINPQYPAILSNIFVSIPAWTYSVPIQIGATSTPKALMNGTFYAYEKNNFATMDTAFESSIYNEWAIFYNDVTSKVPAQNVTDSMNAKFLYFVNKIMNPSYTPPVTLNATLVNVTQDGTFTHLRVSYQAPYNSLVLYMPFDTNTSNTKAYDYTDSHNDGSFVIKAFTNMTFGAYGGSLQLPGDGSFVQLSKIDTVGGASSVTISAWVYAHNGARRVIYDETWDGSTSSRLFLEYQADNTIRCGGRSQSSDGFQAVSTSSPVATEKWVHVACTINLATNGITIFINGTSVPITGSHTFGLTAFQHTSPEYQNIGAAATGINYFNGWIDDFMIFNSSLTGAQISSIYNNQSSRFVKSGTQNYDPIDITPGFSIVDVKTDFQNLMGTNISLKVGFYNGLWQYTVAQNVTGLNKFNITNDTTKITLNYTFIPDNYQFYSPVWLSTETSFENASAPNTPPIVSSIAISPALPYTTENLNCTATLTDVEQTSLFANYTWYVNGASNITGSTNVVNGTNTLISVLPNALTTKGETWTCKIIPFDGTLNGTAANVSIIIQNSAPVLQSINDTTVNEIQTVVIQLNASDSDNDALTYSINATKGSLNSTSGLYTWTTTYADSGVYWFRFNASDGQLSDTKVAKITVVNVLQNSSCLLTSSSGWNISYPNPTTITCSCVGDGATHLYMNGNLADAENNTAIIFGAGARNYVCNITAGAEYGAASVSNTLTINKTITGLVFQVLPSSSVTYLTETNATGRNCPTQLTCSLYRNDILVTNPDVQTLAVGNYIYVYNTSGNENYTSGSIIATLNVGRVASAVSVSINPSSSVTYPTQTTASCSRITGDSTSTLTLYRNGLVVASGTASPQGETNTLAAGTYNYTCTQSLSDNYFPSSSSDNMLNVTKAIPEIHMALNEAESDKNIVYGTQSNATGWTVSGDSSSTKKLYRNSVEISNPDISTLVAGVYIYNYTYELSENYSSASVVRTLTVGKVANPLSLVINPAVIYPTQTTAICSALNGIPTLYRNGAAVTNPETIILGAGGYVYVCNISESVNYLSNSTSQSLTVSQNATNPVDVYINSQKNTNVTIYVGNQSTVIGVAEYSDSGTVSLFRDGVGVSNPETSVLPIGIYAYKANITGNQNYSSNAGVTYYLIVSPLPNAPPVFTTSPVTAINDNISYVYIVNATDPEGNNVTYSLMSGPPGMEINSNTGFLDWWYTYNQGGSYNVTIGASDGTDMNYQSYTLIVTEVFTTHYEFENGFTVVSDIGTNGNISVKKFANDSYYSIELADTGDSISRSFEIASAGTYDIKVRLKSGEWGAPILYVNGYKFILDGVDVTSKMEFAYELVNDTSNIYVTWGSFVIRSADLSSGTHSLVVEANHEWLLADYFEISPAAPVTKFEFETGYSVVSDVGTYPIVVTDYNQDSQGSLMLPDIGDTINRQFVVSGGGTYNIDIRLKSGTHSYPVGQIFGYKILVDGVDVTSRLEFAGNLVNDTADPLVTWGTMTAKSVDLGAGVHAITVEASRDWVLIDYFALSLASPMVKSEFEIGYSTVSDVGSNPISVKQFNQNSLLSVELPDKGDSISKHFSVASAGLYDVNLRLKSGTHDYPFTNIDGYKVLVDGIDVTQRLDVVGDFTNDSAMVMIAWGTISARLLDLSPGDHVLAIEASRDWGLVDYFEIVPASSASRVEVEAGYKIDNDVGNNPILVKNFNADSFFSIELPDTGDKISQQFYVGSTVLYDINVRLKSGAWQWPETNLYGYKVYVDGTDVTDRMDFVGNFVNDTMFMVTWGTVSARSLNLTQGVHSISFEATKDWSMVDYFEIVPASGANKLEMEGGYKVISDVGSNPIVVKKFVSDSQFSVELPDAGDAIQKEFYTPTTDLYNITLRMKTGEHGYPDFNNQSYRFILDGVDVSSQIVTAGNFVDDSSSPYITWGDLVIPYQSLSQGVHQLKIEALSNWLIADYLTFSTTAPKQLAMMHLALNNTLNTTENTTTNTTGNDTITTMTTMIENVATNEITTSTTTITGNVTTNATNDTTNTTTTTETVNDTSATTINVTDNSTATTTTTNITMTTPAADNSTSQTTTNTESTSETTTTDTVTTTTTEMTSAPSIDITTTSTVTESSPVDQTTPQTSTADATQILDVTPASQS